MRELIIVGAGPAGMTAAVYAARKKLDCVVFTGNIGGMAAWSAGIENYMGYSFITGSELMVKFEQQVQELGIPIEYKQVDKIAKNDSLFNIHIEDGEIFQTRSVIIATGRVPRKLNIPGETEFVGKGLTYCATCDAPLFAGKSVAVIGGGNAALSTAEQLIRIAKKVYLVSIKDWTGDPVLQQQISKAKNVETFREHSLVLIAGRQFVERISVRSEITKEEFDIPVQGVFLEIGSEPASKIVEGLLALNERNEIMVDCSNKTRVEGLFAAGDVTNAPYKQIIVAAGEGAKAALSAYDYIINSAN